MQPNCHQESELVTVNEIAIGDKLKLEILFEGEKIYEFRLVFSDLVNLKVNLKFSSRFLIDRK